MPLNQARAILTHWVNSAVAETGERPQLPQEATVKRDREEADERKRPQELSSAVGQLSPHSATKEEPLMLQLRSIQPNT